jgi:tetratricopeptide (TPR) repeat protein
MSLNFIFKSYDHLRYENGRHVSGPHGGANRTVKVEPNISGGEGYTVTVYNLDGNHPVWQNNVQMSPKQMKVIQQTNDKIVLRGYGQDTLGSSFADYGLTVHMKNGAIEKCILHMFDRNVDIEYLKEKEQSVQKISFDQIRDEFMIGVDAINSQNYPKAIIAFNKTLNFLKINENTDKELESSCHYNLGEAYKNSNMLQEAINSFSSAIEVKVSNEDAYLGLSDCYFLLETNEGLKRVIEILSNCILHFPNNEIAHLNKGVALFKLDRYSEAYSSLQRASQLGSHESRMYLEIVKKYVNQ